MESQLHVVASIGFNSSRQNCMTIHHTDLHFLWAVGCLLVVKSIGEDQNTYLKGHEGKITTIVCSTQGDLVATGETLSGLAACIVWNLKSKRMLFRVKVHKQHVQSLSFNCNESLLVSVGGAEDRSQLVCWNLTEGRSQSTQPNELPNYEVTDIKFYNRDPNKFITGHNNGVRF
jgi:WD40 repeat protein